MIVWVVLRRSDYDSHEVWGVYSTKEVAVSVAEDQLGRVYRCRVDGEVEEE